MAEQYLSQDPNAGLEDSGYISTDPNAGLEPKSEGGVVANALAGAGDVIKGFAQQFVPDLSLKHLATIAYGPINAQIQGYNALKSIVDTGEQIAEADKTPPFSRERFAAGFNVAGQLGLLAAGGRAPKLAEIAGIEKPIEAVPQTPEPLVSEVAAKQTETIPEAVPKVEEVIPNAEQVQGPARADVNVQLPGGEAAREVNGGEMPTNVGGEGVPEGGQGETLLKAEVAPTIISGEYQQGTEFSPLGDSIRRRINTLVDDPRVGNLSHPEKGLAAKISADPQYAYDFARKQAEKYPDEASKYNKIADFIDKQWPDIQKPTEVAPPVPQPEQPTKMTVDEAVSKFAKTGVKADEPPVEGKVFRVMSKDEWNHVSRGGENYSGGFWSSDPSEYTGLLSEGDVLAAAPTQGPVQYRGLPKKDLIEAGRQHYNNLERRDITQISDAYRYENGKLVKIKGEPSPVPSAPESTTASSQPKSELPTETTTAQPSPQTEVPTPPVPTETVQTGGDNPQVSRIANRYVEERVASGEIGEIAPGEGYSTQELAAAGLKMPPEETSQHISDLVNKTGDPIKQAQAVRAEESRLSQLSTQASKLAEANPNDANLQAEADDAFKNLTDFHNGPVAQLKENFHALGKSMQGELPVDLSTFNGLREQWLKEVGKPPTPEQDAIIKKQAARVATTLSEDSASRANLRDAIDKATSRRKLPTPEEVQNNIMERMKVEPCLT